MKLSYILIGVIVTLLVGSIFASNYLLKKKYDTMNAIQFREDYTALSRQPFKYLKIDGGNCLSIIPIKKDTFNAVMLRNDEYTDYNFKHILNGNITTQIVDDTLIIKIPAVQRQRADLRRVNFLEIHVKDLASIDITDTYVDVLGLEQPNFTAILRGASRLDLGTKKLEKLALNISSGSQFWAIDSLKINVLEAEVADKGTLNLPAAQVNEFRVKMTENSVVQLSSKMWTKLAAQMNTVK
jgi:hypothetical protein